MAPVYIPLLRSSSSSIISILLILGAPVIEPPGKHSLIHFTELTSSFSSPITVETKWNTVAYSSNLNNSVTLTEKGLHTLLKSFLSKSTIIKSSDLSFSLFVSTLLLNTFKNLSGEELIIWKPSKFK